MKNVLVFFVNVYFVYQEDGKFWPTNLFEEPKTKLKGNKE